MRRRTLIDRNGRLHSAAVLDHWSSEMIKAMGIREATPEEFVDAKLANIPKMAKRANATA